MDTYLAQYTLARMLLPTWLDQHQIEMDRHLVVYIDEHDCEVTSVYKRNPRWSTEIILGTINFEGTRSHSVYLWLDHQQHTTVVYDPDYTHCYPDLFNNKLQQLYGYPVQVCCLGLQTDQDPQRCSLHNIHHMIRQVSDQDSLPWNYHSINEQFLICGTCSLALFYLSLQRRLDLIDALEGTEDYILMFAVYSYLQPGDKFGPLMIWFSEAVLDPSSLIQNIVNLVQPKSGLGSHHRIYQGNKLRFSTDQNQVFL